MSIVHKTNTGDNDSTEGVDSINALNNTISNDCLNIIPSCTYYQDSIKTEPVIQNENVVDNEFIETPSETSISNKSHELENEGDNSAIVSLEHNLCQQEDLSNPCPVITSSFKLIQCDLCFSCFSSQHDFDVHRKDCDNPIQSSFTCNLCNTSFDTNEKLDNHIICHEVSRPFSCRSCGTLFKQKKHMQQHICSQRSMNLICHTCGLEFTKLSSLKNHMKIHNYQAGREMAIPDFCETVLSNNQSWNNGPPTLTPLMPQLDIPNTTDASHWNSSFTFNNSLDSKGLHDSMNISQDINVNSSFTSILDNQSFHNEFEHIDEVSIHSDTAEMKHHYEICTSEENKLSMVSPQVQNTTPEPKSNVENDIKRKPHVCKYCGVSFTREKALISHERFHQDCLTDIFECKKCGEVYLNKEDLKVHICSKSYDKLCAVQYRPNVQNTIVQNESEEVHSNIEPQTHQSENIEYQESDYVNLPRSPISETKQNKHVCEHCFKTFTTKQKKYRHMWIHRNKTFSCEVCADSFSTQGQLNQHRLSSHEGNTPHGCAICGKCFASRQGLWEHMRLHKEGTAPHQCTLCGKTFTSRQGYHIHLRTHTGERPYGCRYCWKSFRDGGTLRKHERIHTGERPHVCPLCYRAFNQKVVLREHVRWLHCHHPAEQNQPFIACPIPECHHTLTDKEDLCAHIVKHSDTLTNFKQSAAVRHVKMKVKPAPLPESIEEDIDDSSEAPAPDNHCEMCGETFPHKDLLLSHIKIHI